MRIEKAAPGCGAIVTGADITLLGPAEWQQIYQAWLDSGVIVIRGQNLTIQQFLEHGRRFVRSQVSAQSSGSAVSSGSAGSSAGSSSFGSRAARSAVK